MTETVPSLIVRREDFPDESSFRAIQSLVQQIRQINTSGGVPSSRTLTAGSGLSGGGDLSADRTFSLDLANANTWTALQTFSAGINFGQSDFDFYEKGVWTPVLIGSTTAGNHTYSTQTGRYTRIGNLVNVTWIFQLSAYDTGAAGQPRIDGLPFNAVNDRESAFLGVIGGIGSVPSNFSDWWVDTFSSTVRIFYLSSALGSRSSVDIDNFASDTLQLRGSATYRI